MAKGCVWLVSKECHAHVLILLTGNKIYHVQLMTIIFVYLELDPTVYS